MEHFTLSDRRRAWAIGLVAAIAAAAATSAAGSRWYVAPGKAIIFGAFGAVCINVAVFSIDLLSSTRQWKHARTEEELAEYAVPALRGKLNTIGARTARISAFLLMACIGTLAGAVVAQLMRFATALARSR